MASDRGNPIGRLFTGTLRHVIRAVLYGAIGSLVMLVTVVVITLERRPDLDVWHTERLDAEFTVRSEVTSFDEYLALEERLFAQLDEQVYAASPAGDDHVVNRYRRGSLSDPGRWPTNWNRSFELTAQEPKAGVLLLHGLSDSPYSMRSLAHRLHAHGATVVVPRVPGHGTAPSGLLKVRWQDMAAAVALAVQHVRAKTGERPLYIVGYSNGGALAVEYALMTLSDPSLPPADGLVLISPEIGITKLAGFAVWQERLGRLLGLRKMSWNSLSPEYDPYKYGSFALNAGRQAYLLTNEIQKRITAHAKTGDLERFPPVLAFQSAVDATVLAPALVHGLLERLPPAGHEIVVFDVNRLAGVDELLTRDPLSGIDRELDDADRPFVLSLLTNRSKMSSEVLVRRSVPGETVTETDLELTWPRDVYSLSHIALPFPPDDPVYGGPDAADSPGVQFGNLVLRGERGALLISGTEIMRLRWNPFYDYLEQRTLEFTGLSGETVDSTTHHP